ncbi:MAG TPA: GDSL-type esterase/lipase family protein [Solirubrobacteraceae bacterium]|nr:GDSL-type esterase/lipase family protein [Solirubrobacteraceae bacterium]
MHGVLAFGDSITNGGGELQWGVALQSWALWTARGLGLPYTGYAVDGAAARDVVEEQIPRAERVSALGADARYHVGCLYIGVNDVRRDDWDAGEFAERHRAGLGYVTERCERTLALTVPARLGRPATPPRRIEELNGAIEASAAAAGALVLDLRDFGARNQVMADRVHPTAFGQIAIAERALARLAADGLPTRIHPCTLVSYSTTWPRRLQGDITYAYRAAKRYLPGPD